MKALVADALAPEAVEALRGLGLEVALRPGLDAQTLPEAAAAAEILIVRGKKVSAAVFERARRLALVVRAGAGVNTIDVEAASHGGVFVTNCPGQNSIAVAELTWGLILAADRRIPQARAELLAGRWNKQAYQEAEGLYGKTLGILGLGAIGREVAARAPGFGVEVLAWSRSLDEARAKQLGVRRAATPRELVQGSDIVSLHLPSNAATASFVGRELLGALRPGTLLVNTARGELVDEDALRAALDAGRLRYATDVFVGEPGAGAADFAHPLAQHPQVIATPHIGASTAQAQRAIADEAVRIVRAFVRDGRILNCVNLKTTAPGVVLSVRHYDRVGVLARVLDAVRRAEVNVQDVENVIFATGGAASARIGLAGELPAVVLAELRALPDVIAATVTRAP